MRSANNFNPEWGYFAPRPSFLRTARIVLVAAAIGATSGGAVVFALIEPPSAEVSVAARTLVRSSDAAFAATTAVAAPAQPMPVQPHIAVSARGSGPADPKGSKPLPAVHSTARVAALAEAPTVTVSPPSTGEAAALTAKEASANAAAASAAPASSAPVQRKVVVRKPPRPAWAGNEQAFMSPYGGSRAPVALSPYGGFWQRGAD